jgi:type IV pilus assembly protein PilM
MILWPFSKKRRKLLGVDIGTSSIKVIEILDTGKKMSLLNYGEVATPQGQEKNTKSKTFHFSPMEVGNALQKIVEEAGMDSREAIFSIPDFLSFFTVIQIPSMTKDEISNVVEFEARQHIPIPINEIALDWSIIKEDKKGYKLLLVAVPKRVIAQYQEIATVAGLKLKGIEAEVFSLLKSLVRDEKGMVCLIDIGAHSTTISIVDDGVLKISYSFDFSGKSFTTELAEKTGMDYNKAEEEKITCGLIGENDKVKSFLCEKIDEVVNETLNIIKNFQINESKKVDKVILAGGTVLLPGMKEYFTQKVGGQVEIANPFNLLSYPDVLKDELKKMGPSYAIAVGATLRAVNKKK